MSTRLTSATPTFAVPDVAEAASWYRDNLGFSVRPFPASEPYGLASLVRDGVEIVLVRVEGFRKPVVRGDEARWDAQLRVHGVDALYETITGRVEIVMPLHRRGHGDWEFAVRDPNGYRLVFSERQD